MNSNLLRTPDDSTAIVRMMGEFNDFLQNDPKLRLTFDDANVPENVDTPVPSTSLTRQPKHAPKTTTLPAKGLSRSQSHGSVLRPYREKEVEIYKNRSKIAYLEGELNSMEKSNKRARVEFEREHGMHKQELNQREEDFDELRRSVKYALDQEKLAKEQLADIKKEFENFKKKSETKIQTLQREKLKFASEIEETRQEASQKHSDLRNTLTRREAERLILQNKLEETESQLTALKRRYSHSTNDALEVEELRNEARNAKHRVKELEEQLSRQEEAARIALSMQSQLTKTRALENDNMKLAEDNRYYRETNDSNLLLKEETESLRAKLSRAEQRLKDLIQLELENEELKKRIHKWELEDKAGNKRLASPVELTQEISKLQKSQVVLLEKQSEIMSSSQINESAYKRAADELANALKELEVVKESDLRYQGLCQRLQRRLFLVTADRDGCRRTLNAFDHNFSANYDPQLKQRLEEAETLLTSYHQHIETLETEVSQAKEEVSNLILKQKEMERSLSELKNSKTTAQQSTPLHQEDASKLKAEIEKLKAENTKLAEKLEIYELRKEQMHMQGYFDPRETKVVHFAMNPTSTARQQKAEVVQKLEKENELLRQKIRMLEEGKASPGDTSAWENLSPPEAGPSVMRQVEDVKAQLSSSELRNQRLKEVFSRKIQEFREACYALTGYKIDVVREKQYRLQSMYAERANDDLLFESNSKGEMMMLHTDFSTQVADHIDTYLKKMNSIPAFLSNLTLDLFSKQTTTIVIN